MRQEMLQFCLLFLWSTLALCADWEYLINKDVNAISNYAYSAYQIQKQSFAFCVLDGHLYVKTHAEDGDVFEFETRGAGLRLGMWQAMQRKRSELEAVRVCGKTSLDDSARPELAGGPPTFAFNRPVNSTFPEFLVPDWDHWGWFELHIPPLNAVRRSFAVAAPPPFEQRASSLYWGGNTQGLPLREALRRCAEAHPELVHVHLVHDWKTGMTSPVQHREHDLRHSTRYKYLAYVEGHGWSTSLKRIVAAGGLTFLPQPPRFEDLTSLSLFYACPNCFAYYNASANGAFLCDSLTAELKAAEARPPADLAASAQRSLTALDDWLSPAALDDYFVQLFKAVSKTQSLGNLTADRLVADGFVELNCSFIKKDYFKRLQPQLHWQLLRYFHPHTCIAFDT